MPAMKRPWASFGIVTSLLFLALAALLAFPAGSLGVRPTSFVYPLIGTQVSSNFGFRQHPVLKSRKHHGGIDLAAPDGAPIRAVAQGTVIFADPYKSYGRLIVIRHSGGMTTHYGHCETIRVRPGQRVKPGEIIGAVGHTGRVTGPHLHFEVRLEGIAQDPQRFISGLALPAAG